MSVYLRCPGDDCPLSAEGTRFRSGTLIHCPHCHRELVAATADDMGLSWPKTLLPENEQRVAAGPDIEGEGPSAYPVVASTAWEPLVGSTFAGRYRIIRELGRGGMGTVHLAHDNDLDRDVALKIPSRERDSESFRTRFQREARAGAQLGRNRNICGVLDVGQIDGVPYLTMDYIPGRRVSDLLKENPAGLPALDAVRWVSTLSSALGEAHARGIVHRDLKPSNVMIREDGTPVLMDFGLARRETDERITGGVLGTPAYMSPEQAMGDFRNVGPATDIYSLGVILYELLTGRTPFPAPTMREVLRRIVSEDPRPPSADRPNLDPRLDAICLKAMAKATSDRFATMAEFSRELQRFLTASGSPGKDDGHPSPPEPPGPPPKLGPSSRHPLRMVVGATLSLATVAALGGWLIHDTSSSRSETPSPSSTTLPPPAHANLALPVNIAPDPASVGPVSSGAAAPTHPPVRAPTDRRPSAHPINPVSGFTGMAFVLIKPGEFLMGSPAGEGQADERPQHRVLIRRPFLLAKYEVTQSEYQKVIGEDPSHFSGNVRRPVERVSWLDAVRFCNALSARDEIRPFFRIEGDVVTVPDWSGDGYRLPTEAEWEYACRAGLTGKFGFAHDDRELGEHAWYRENSRPNGSYETQPVGGKKANDFGLHDMQGNVWEWCWDRYAANYPPDNPVADPIGTAAGSLRVLRGGTYNSPPGILRCAVRNEDEPTSKSQCNGFRVARTVQE